MTEPLPVAVLATHPDYRIFCEGLVANRLCLIERITDCDLSDPVAVALMLRFVQKESDVAPVDFCAAVPEAHFGNLLDWSNARNMPEHGVLVRLRAWLVGRFTKEVDEVSSVLLIERKRAL